MMLERRPRTNSYSRSRGSSKAMREVNLHEREWICDECQKPIRNVLDGFVEWIRNEDDIDCDFRVVHIPPASLYYPRGDCYRYTHKRGRRDMPLLWVVEYPEIIWRLNPRNRARLLRKLSGR